MIQHVQSHERRSPGPGGRPGFSLIETVMVVWVVGILMAVAIPTFGSARNTSRARIGAGAVAEEIRHAGQTAFAERRVHTLDAGTQTDALLLKPQARPSQLVLDLQSDAFRSVLVASTLDHYGTSLTLNSGGDATSAVSWSVVCGSTSVTVTQEVGAVNPVIGPPSKASKTATDKYIARILKGLL